MLDIINQINRPSEKQSYQDAATTYSTSVYGSTQNFVEYIQSGELLRPYVPPADGDSGSWIHTVQLYIR